MKGLAAFYKWRTNFPGKSCLRAALNKKKVTCWPQLFKIVVVHNKKKTVLKYKFIKIYYLY